MLDQSLRKEQFLLTRCIDFTLFFALDVDAVADLEGRPGGRG